MPPQKRPFTGKKMKGSEKTHDNQKSEADTLLKMLAEYTQQDMPPQNRPFAGKKIKKAKKPRRIKRVKQIQH